MKVCVHNNNTTQTIVQKCLRETGKYNLCLNKINAPIEFNEIN